MGQNDFLNKIKDLSFDENLFVKSPYFSRKIISDINDSILKNYKVVKNKQTINYLKDVFEKLDKTKLVFDSENQKYIFFDLLTGINRTKEHIVIYYNYIKSYMNEIGVEIIDGKNLDNIILSVLRDFILDLSKYTYIKSEVIDEVLDFLKNIDRITLSDYFIFINRYNIRRGTSVFNFLENQEKFYIYIFYFLSLKIIEYTLDFLKTVIYFGKKEDNNLRCYTYFSEVVNALEERAKKFVNTYLPNEKINVSGRVKTLQSMVRKALLKREYPDDIYDYFGLMFEFVSGKFTEENLEKLKTILEYLPSIILVSGNKENRTRNYLLDERDNKNSNSSYKAVHITFKDFGVILDNNFKLINLPLEVKIVIQDDGKSHDLYRSKQYKNLLKDYFLCTFDGRKTTLEDFYYIIFKYLFMFDEKQFVSFSRFDNNILYIETIDFDVSKEYQNQKDKILRYILNYLKDMSDDEVEKIFNIETFIQKSFNSLFLKEILEESKNKNVIKNIVPLYKSYIERFWKELYNKFLKYKYLNTQKKEIIKKFVDQIGAIDENKILDILKNIKNDRR